MSEVFRRFGPCLVLIDEWVAYARQLFETSELLPGGTFETQFSFAQTLADAAIAVPGVLLVVSLPVSDDPARPGSSPIGSEAEVGGVAGQEAARRLGNVIARTETSWRPASAEESFEIVRRRLFEPIAADRDQGPRRYRPDLQRVLPHAGGGVPERVPRAGVHRQDQAVVPDPPGAVRPAVRGLVDAGGLPAHPRRAPAHGRSDLSALGGQRPVAADPARRPSLSTTRRCSRELTRNLDHAWQPILDTRHRRTCVGAATRLTGPFRTWAGTAAARRAARAVFLASAPRAGSANRGVEIQRVKLACTLPGESVATYGDALNRLTDRSSYLYVEGARYWYGTQASVARRARELVEQLLSTRRDEVHAEIVRRLRDQARERGDFVAVHVCPAERRRGAGRSRRAPGDPRRRIRRTPTGRQLAGDDDGTRHPRPARVRPAAVPQHARLPGPRPEAPRRTRERIGRVPGLEGDRGPASGTEPGRLPDEPGAVEDGPTPTAPSICVSQRPTTGAWFPISRTRPAPSSGKHQGRRARARLVSARAEAREHRFARRRVRGRAAPGLLSTEGVLAPMWADGYTTVNALWDAFARYPYLPRLKSLDIRSAPRPGRGANPIAWQIIGFALADAVDPDTGRSSGSRTHGERRPSLDDTGCPTRCRRPSARCGYGSDDRGQFRVPSLRRCINPIAWQVRAAGCWTTRFDASTPEQ